MSPRDFYEEAGLRATEQSEMMLGYLSASAPVPEPATECDAWHAMAIIVAHVNLADPMSLEEPLRTFIVPSLWRNVVAIQTPATPDPLELQYAILRRSIAGLFEVSEARLLGRTAQERPELQPMHALAGGYQRGITVTLEPQAKLRVAVPSSVGRIVPHFYLRWWAVRDQPDNDTEAECDIDFGDCVEMTGTIEVSATLPFIPNARFACAIEDKKG